MKIYLDMDGVLCDFNHEFERMFGKRPEEWQRRRKHFYSYWKDFVEDRAFERLPKHKNADELLTYVNSLGVPIEILSSSGGQTYHYIVERQKKLWLEKHGIDYKVNIVPGGVKKAEFADPWSILIDDSEHVIEAYRKAGGTAILHHDIRKTIEKLSQLHLEWRGGQ